MKQITIFKPLLSTKACKGLKNDFKLTFAFDLLEKLEAVPHEWKSFPNPSDTQ